MTLDRTIPVRRLTYKSNAVAINNLQASNIKKDVTILGITGTLESQPILITKTITNNGIYNAQDDNADGYSQVTVNIDTSNFTDIDIFMNGGNFLLDDDFCNLIMLGHAAIK